MASSTSIPLSTASITLTPPPLVALRPYYVAKTYVSFSDDHTAVLAEGVFSPRVQIAVEYAMKIDPDPSKRYVNLRFCYSNRYMGRSEDSVIPIAQLLQPDEDTTTATSTLFELSKLEFEPYQYFLRHVQSGTTLMLKGANNTLELSNNSQWEMGQTLFELVDWQGIVKVPQYVAFKGSNGSYLRGYSFNGLPYLQFSSHDPNRDDSVYEVELQGDGYVKIKSPFFSGNYWRNSTCWIWADTHDSSSTDKSLLFWPVKHDKDTIALRSALNDQFCVNLSADGKVNCLDANCPTITTDAQLVVQELVSNRKLYNVTYRMADTRIFNEKPYTAGSTTADNETDEEASVSVSLEYKESKSYTFTNSTTLTAGVATTIEADLVEIAKGSVEISVQVTDSFESGKITTIEKTTTATGLVTVPPKTSATVYYVGTLGTCDVPFSYTREDKSSSGGHYSYHDEDDGIYTGVNAYNFSFTFVKPPETL